MFVIGVVLIAVSIVFMSAKQDVVMIDVFSFQTEALTACEASAMCPRDNSVIRCNTDGDGNCISGVNSIGQTFVQCGGNIATCSSY